MATKRKLIIISGLLGVLLIAGITLIVVLVVNAEPSQQDIEKWAYSYTGKVFHVRSGTAQIVFSRTATMTEMYASGLEAGNIGKPDLPLRLVIIKGDFDDTSLPGYGSFGPVTPFKYISLVFDPRSKIETPFSIMSSVDGSLYKKILNDPTLPDPPTLGSTN